MQTPFFEPGLNAAPLFPDSPSCGLRQGVEEREKLEPGLNDESLGSPTCGSKDGGRAWQDASLINAKLQKESPDLHLLGLFQQVATRFGPVGDSLASGLVIPSLWSYFIPSPFITNLRTLFQLWCGLQLHVLAARVTPHKSLDEQTTLLKPQRYRYRLWHTCHLCLLQIILPFQHGSSLTYHQTHNPNTLITRSHNVFPSSPLSGPAGYGSYN